MTSSFRPVASALGLAFLAGPWREAELVDRAARVVGEHRAWIGELVTAVLAHFESPPAARHDALRDFIAANRAFRRAFAKGRTRPELHVVFATSAIMAPPRWPVPLLSTTSELADFLRLTPAELDWFADVRGVNAHAAAPNLAHYTFRWVRKRSGGLRLLEAPRSRLKAFQRRLLRELIEHVPVHEAVHGFVRGRSVVSAAERHAGKAVVLRLDLADFFTSIRARRVELLFRSVGYPDRVACWLAGLVTVTAPGALLANLPRPAFHEFRDRSALDARRRLVRELGVRHLAQGAPTSPALANLCAFPLDVRLAKAAAAVGAVYTRYADDLVFSGAADFSRRVSGFAALVAAVALEEGFRVNFRKTRVMRAGARQCVAGVVVNRAPGVRRSERERLEAILTNALRHGIESQNRDGLPNFLEHLRGRVAWVTQVNATQGARLQALLERCRSG